MQAPSFAAPQVLFARSGRRRLRAAAAGVGAPPRAALARSRRSENVAGDMYVDSRCIDCDTCRWLAPETFNRQGSKSAVHAQPAGDGQKKRALAAAAACPTGSIHSTAQPSAAARNAAQFPMPVSELGVAGVDGVYYLGLTNEKTYGASAWLVVDGGAGVMIDCPRFTQSLARRVRALCDVAHIVLTHRDDVAGHERWARALGAVRVIHAADANAAQLTHQCETQLVDADFPYALGEGVDILHVPGHTHGCIALLHRRSQSLFTGDHLYYSTQRGGLIPLRSLSRAWEQHIDSVRMLAQVPFLHAWPGHGGHFHFKDAEERRERIFAAAADMEDGRVVAALDLYSY